MAKRKEYEDDDFLDESIDELVEDDDEDELDEEDSGEEAAGDDSAEEVKETQEEEVEEEDYPPDDEKAVAALKKLGVRLDVSEKGNIWRVIFDDTNGKDPALVLLNGLPGLKELWLLGTKITADAVKEFKEERPKVTVYY